MSGASGTNDDMVVGRTNNSEDRTLLIATNGGNYEDGFILSVSATDDTLLVANPNGVDGIHAKGTKLFATGGQTIRPGNVRGSTVSSATSMPRPEITLLRMARMALVPAWWALEVPPPWVCSAPVQTV